MFIRQQFNTPLFLNRYIYFMATYTPVSKLVGTTGASGAAGIVNLMASQVTAMATAVGTAIGLTGYSPNSLVISPAQLVVDTDSHVLDIVQTITYTIIT